MLLLFCLGLLSPGPWSDVELDAATRASMLLANMSLGEKLVYLHGPRAVWGVECSFSARCAYVGNVQGNRRLGIPPLNLQDGPQGVRLDRYPSTTTAWPSGLAMAATWDVDAVSAWGEAMGREFRAKGVNVGLGPGLNVARVPLNGRNFEYLSGEEPYLGAGLVGAAVRGIQSQGVIANAKHWVLNNQETERYSVSSMADERTKREVYYPPFAAAAAAGVGSAMCSYNRIDGRYSCENAEELSVLRELGFDGWVMSDWGATHSLSLTQGLDMEMPFEAHMGAEAVARALGRGELSLEDIDRTVLRTLGPMLRMGVMDAPAEQWNWRRAAHNVTSLHSAMEARRLSAAATVLLKNEPPQTPNEPPPPKEPPRSARAALARLLPLPTGRRYALLGLADRADCITHGGGSGAVTGSYVTSPLEGFRLAAGGSAVVSYASGRNLSAAVALALAADYAIVFAGDTASEGRDRTSLALPCLPASDGGVLLRPRSGGALAPACVGASSQDELIAAVAAAQPKTVVVLSVPGAVLTPWRAQVPAILTNFMPGQAVGHAVADVLFGVVSPAARLPLTWPNRENETALSSEQWPGVKPHGAGFRHANYTEGALIGYRYYDQHRITPAFAFGHGLGYAAFRYANLEVSRSGVSFALSNEGTRIAAEVPQLYLGFPPEVGEPPKLLRGFRKVELRPHETRRIHFELCASALSVWSVEAHKWVEVDGGFDVMIGASSQDIRLRGGIPPKSHAKNAAAT